MNSPNILLAEDDLDDYNFFIEALKEAFPGSKVVRAKNGLECISNLKSNPFPEIIFLDLNIPIKSGLECLNYIKETETLRDIPVIIYSKSHYIKNIDAAFKMGAFCYIVKPSNAGDLVEILTTVAKKLKISPVRTEKTDFVIRKKATLEI